MPRSQPVTANWMALTALTGSYFDEVVGGDDAHLWSPVRSFRRSTIETRGTVITPILPFKSRIADRKTGVRRCGVTVVFPKRNTSPGAGVNSYAPLSFIPYVSMSGPAMQQGSGAPEQFIDCLSINLEAPSQLAAFDALKGWAAEVEVGARIGLELVAPENGVPRAISRFGFSEHDVEGLAAVVGHPRFAVLHCHLEGDSKPPGSYVSAALRLVALARAQYQTAQDQSRRRPADRERDRHRKDMPRCSLHRARGYRDYFRARRDDRSPSEPPPKPPFYSVDYARNGRTDQRRAAAALGDVLRSGGLNCALGTPRPRRNARGVSELHTCAADTIGRFNGKIAKYMGNGVLVYFGYPTSETAFSRSTTVSTV
jgi:hypothetical protein